jgi:hypothetical protein
MVSHMPHRAYHNPDHAGPGPAGSPPWPINHANRFDRGPRPRLAVGDRYLSALRIVHETLAERGVAETIRLFDSRQLARAAEAGRYFDLDDLADLLDHASRAAGVVRDAAAFDDEYQRRFVAGTALRDAVAHKMARYPSDFGG